MDSRSTDILEIMDILYGMSSDMADRIVRLRGRKDAVVIEKFRQNAKGVYDDYPFHSTSDEAAFRGNGVVYTVITGDYDILREPEYVCPEFDHICYTDNKNLRSKTWKIRYIENPDGFNEYICKKGLEKAY